MGAGWSKWNQGTDTTKLSQCGFSFLCERIGDKTCVSRNEIRVMGHIRGTELDIRARNVDYSAAQAQNPRFCVPSNCSVKKNMRTHALIIFAAGFLTLASRAEDESHKEIKIVQPEVAIYSIGSFEGISTTRLFVLSEDKSGYTITSRTGEVIAKDVYYVKTFGGAFGAIAVHIIQDRFIIYPETVKASEVPDTLFHEMHAVTHVYDLKNRRILTSSEKYRYDHDVPLRYDWDKVIRAAFRADEDEQAGARQPATAPDSKSEGNEKPKLESKGRCR